MIFHYILTKRFFNVSIWQDCGMTFKLKHSLKKHQLVHKPEFGHTCDFCGKKFKVSHFFKYLELFFVFNLIREKQLPRADLFCFVNGCSVFKDVQKELTFILKIIYELAWEPNIAQCTRS